MKFWLNFLPLMVNIIDFTTDKITYYADKVVEFAVSLFNKVWPKKKIKKEDIDEEA